MKTLGILGGMGPLASAEFLDTIYRLNPTEPEQAAPVCLLDSDPTFPDRTEAILRGCTRPLTERLSRALARLLAMGADRIIVACVTIHHVLPEVAPPLRERVISLIDLIVDEVLLSPRHCLLLATNGTRAGQIFERHGRWSAVENRMQWLDEPDQRELHGWIYRLKGNHQPDECLRWLDTLAPKYGTDGLVCGCTELHILVKALERRHGGFDPRFIDPLLLAARRLPSLFVAEKGPTSC